MNRNPANKKKIACCCLVQQELALSQQVRLHLLNNTLNLISIKIAFFILLTMNETCPQKLVIDFALSTMQNQQHKIQNTGHLSRCLINLYGMVESIEC